MGPGCEAEQSSPSSAEVKKEWSCTSTPTMRHRGEYRKEFTFMLHKI
jgi:hypothetical protein